VNQEEKIRQLAQRALQHYQDHTTDQAPSTMRMPIEAYTDHERYQAERERIFKHLPLALGLSLELPKPGDYKALTVLDTPVLLIRADDGQVRAFLNVCRHRGAKVCADGHAHARVLSCPYHAWVYDRQGQLIGRYGDETFGDVDSSLLGLTELCCAERCGLLWVSLTPGESFDINDWLGEFAAELDTLKLDTWHIFEQRDLQGPGWKVTMDGYLEAYHHNLVHKETVGKYTVGNLLVLDTFGPHQRLTFGRQSLGELARQAEQDWQPDEHIRLIHSGFPNLSISGILGDHCLVSQIFPGQTPNTTVTTQTILVANKPTSTAEKTASREFSDLILRAVQDEDYAIGFGIQSGMGSNANTEFIFGRNEPAVQNYHTWIARFMDQATDAR
jgi:phenylpropionate dioxygenase-like ring-hydroxylating dioxygenase large terminal subunit